ncbi:hypothetical protein L6452_19486 [Arctium lappa]|uniref:Uncharacterized protein n=1 Tax=Arctium lappa TaxID=4217 RepID=A0ACB9B861_ARCLA|nr:hypothetical protein L6452_19486 [Arctium lappa]
MAISIEAKVYKLSMEFVQVRSNHSIYVGLHIVVLVTTDVGVVELGSIHSIPKSVELLDSTIMLFFKAKGYTCG